MRTDSQWRLSALLGALVLGGCGSRAPAQPCPQSGEASDAAPPGTHTVASSMGASGTVVDIDHRGSSTESELSATCPVVDSADPDRLLDVGNARYDAGEYALALACAEVATDLIPQAVEAHHLRAASLSALQRFGDAQLAFTMALALDPDDPETLAAAADFYVNALQPRTRGSTMVGLEYARRGSNNAAMRRRRDRALRARLALLEGQSLNDLGRADEALPRVQEALVLFPSLSPALYEQGVSLFNLCRFEQARQAFSAVLVAQPDDAYAHHYLGLLYERQGNARDAESHLQRARMLAPGEFFEPIFVSVEDFQRRVTAAVAALPADQRQLLEGVKLETPDLPALSDLTAVDPPFAPTILGLYRGLPVGVEATQGEPAPGRAIALYRNNLGRAVRTLAELDGQIRRTLEHEVGHLKGLDEDELRRYGLE